MPHLTTHVLDAVAGTPAPGIALVLTDAASAEVARGTTDADGRAGLGPDLLAPGDYSLRFDTGAYFASAGVEAFYPRVTITFSVTSDRRYHVPILLSPFAFSTYRGS